MNYDIVIRGGTIVDGTGDEPILADVGIANGRITKIGQIAERGNEEIDATDRLVTLGFVDVHTHYDGQATWEHTLAPSSNHGVTSVVMGNCGVGFAPCRPAQREMLVKLMEGVEDVPEVVMTEGLPYDATIVGGQITYRDGKATGKLPGRMARGAQAAPRMSAQSAADRSAQTRPELAAD